MKFFAAALSASSLASVSAADENGFTGSGAAYENSYTFVGAGYCLPHAPAGTSTNYNVVQTSGFSTVDECATHCQSFSNLEGQVGFDTSSTTCNCRYTDGTGPVSATTEEGITWSPNTENASGSIGYNVDPSGQYCYRRNAFVEKYTGSDYTFVGIGYCLPANTVGGLPWYNEVQKGGFSTVDECATHCKELNNIEGQVGFDTNDYHCNCRYIDGTGPVSATTEEGITNHQGPGIGAIADTNKDYQQNHNFCYRRNAFGQTDSPTNSPSNSPSTAPTGTLTNGPSTSPSKTPTGSPVPAVTAGGAAAPEDSLYYPDWSKSNGGCKTGGGQPTYMTLGASTWMFATLSDCCARYFGWMLNECKGASGAAPSGLWFPDWAGADDTCKNDGSEPEYMALNPGSWMHSSKQECCEANFSWMLNECLGSSDPNAGATTKWYMVWSAGFKCKQDCVGTGPSCGGLAKSWDQLFETRAACCAEKASWNPTDCLVD